MYLSDDTARARAEAFQWQPLSPETSPPAQAADAPEFFGISAAIPDTGEFVPLAVDDSAGETPADMSETGFEAAGVSEDPADAEAAANAEAALATVNAKSALIEQEAYEKGFAQGEKDGFELGEKKALQQAEHIVRLLDELKNLRRILVQQYEQEIMSAVCAVAEKIVYERVQRDSAVIQNTVLKALELAAEKSEVRLRVHPDDYRIVENCRPDIFSAHPEMKSVVVTADPAVDRGGCVVETQRGTVDATVATRLKSVREAVHGVFEESADG